MVNCSEMNKRKKDLVEAYSVHLATMSLLIYFKELLKFTDASDKSVSSLAIAVVHSTVY